MITRIALLAGESKQPSYTQKHIEAHVIFHAHKLCSHVHFCVRDGHVQSLVRGVDTVT